MNRIILIGNGFDLAHGLPTDYKSFLDYYWKNLIEKIKKSTNSKHSFENDDILIEELPWRLEANSFDEAVVFLKKYHSKIIFKNKLLENISTNASISGWVDIENEYYKLLVSISEDNIFDEYEIDHLNQDLERLQHELANYLKSLEEPLFDQGSDYKKEFIELRLKSLIHIKELVDTSKNQLKEKFKTDVKEIQKLIKEDRLRNVNELKTHEIEAINALEENEYELDRWLRNEKNLDTLSFFPKEVLVLNFNYTSLEKLYCMEMDDFFATENKHFKTETIHIHGSLSINSESLIFGFGDEFDDSYQRLEKLNDNRYLKNIKSIQYLESDRYKKLIQFINSDSYQVFVLGHSCGLSDRTLLNSLFEHENCVSIKPYYYQINKTEDNYSDVVRNISRNFNDKASMRDKVVNKKYCEPLS